MNTKNSVNQNMNKKYRKFKQFAFSRERIKRKNNKWKMRKLKKK